MALKMYKSISFKKGLKKVKCVMAVASGKGGVGKTTFTALLAKYLQKKGKNVGILDADIYGASICEIFKPDALKTDEEGGIFPAQVQDISLVSMAHFKQSHDAFIARAPFATAAIEKFLNDVYWGELDFLFIDFPPGTGDIHLTLAQKAPITASLLITTPQHLSVVQVVKTASMFNKLKIPILGVIENMSHFLLEGGQKCFPFGQDGGQMLAQSLNTPLLAQIPLQQNIEKQETFSLFESIYSAIKSREDVSLNEVSSIELVDKNILHIGFKEGSVLKYFIKDLQSACPCAACSEKVPFIQEGVSLSQAENVGRYALRFTFSSGCSKGIFSYALLRTLGK